MNLIIKDLVGSFGIELLNAPNVATIIVNNPEDAQPVFDPLGFTNTKASAAVTIKGNWELNPDSVLDGVVQTEYMNFTDETFIFIRRGYMLQFLETAVQKGSREFTEHFIQAKG